MDQAAKAGERDSPRQGRTGQLKGLHLDFPGI